MTTLCWIRNERPWKQYVQHRVDEIRKLTSKNDWRHCPGKQNPADLPSRGVNAKELSTDSGEAVRLLKSSNAPTMWGLRS